MVKSPWGLKVNPYPHFVIEPLILMDLMGTWCQISQAWLVQVEASGVARGIEASLLHLGGRFRSLFICTRARLYSTALAQSLRSSWTSACSESCDSIKDHWEQPKWTTYPSCNQTRQWKITENHPFSKFSPLIFPAINNAVFVSLRAELNSLVMMMMMTTMVMVMVMMMMMIRVRMLNGFMIT